LVREDSNLNLNEIRSLATSIGMTGGAVLVSDRMATLSNERKEIIQALLPLIPSQPQVLDRFQQKEPRMLKQELQTKAGAWPVIAYFNWEARDVDLTFRPTDWGFPARKTWIAREFWSGEVYTWQGDLIFPKVPSHAVKLMTLHEENGGCIYLGSDFHFSQGYEIKSWLEKDDALIFTMKIDRVARGEIFLWLPKTPERILQDGQEISWEPTAVDKVYCLKATIDQESKFFVAMKA